MDDIGGARCFSEAQPDGDAGFGLGSMRLAREIFLFAADVFARACVVSQTGFYEVRKNGAAESRVGCHGSESPAHFFITVLAEAHGCFFERFSGVVE